MGMSANCDKCGKWMTQKEFGRKGACLSLMYGFEYRTFTLCKVCRKAFEKWMGEKAEEVEDEHGLD